MVVNNDHIKTIQQITSRKLAFKVGTGFCPKTQLEHSVYDKKIKNILLKQRANYHTLVQISLLYLALTRK